MNLEDALRSLFLRQLRADRLTAAAAGDSAVATQLATLAETLCVERDKAQREYRVSLIGTARAWNFPEQEFQFYTRGDRPPAGSAPSVCAEDEPYESNLRNARKWLQIFRTSSNA